jgi:3-dehydroquinate synthase
LIKVSVDFSEVTTYKITVGRNLLADLPKILESTNIRPPLLIITQAGVLKAVGNRLVNLDRIEKYILPEGESAKGWKVVEQLLEEMAKRKLNRDSAVIAIGGGVVGDVAGFAASVYLRGIPAVQIPTTLLAQLDSSIGGKTGINTSNGKNLLGAFHHPSLVVSDLDFLQTLSDRQYASGLFEGLKYGVILDPELFESFESKVELFRRRDSEVEEDLVSRCARLKAKVVAEDPRERNGIRKILNYGHTIGHGIEAAAEDVLHGEAVAYGMIAANWIAVKQELLSQGDADRIEKSITGIGMLPSLAGLKAETVLAKMKYDKKATTDGFRFVLPTGIGRVKASVPVSDRTVEDAVRSILEKTHDPALLT